jgi:hypothetical protein
MSEISQDTWTPYSVGEPSTRKNWVNPDCQRLSVVSHVTHVNNALEVLRAGSIKPQLIYDKSRLNTRRVLVVWLSPNDWSGAGGFRYGNIAFDFDWEKLIEDKRFYWIGAMKYTPMACRILITEKDRDEKLMPYLPGNGDGPWRVDEKHEKHYWNGNHCLEFMLEGEIPLSSVSELRFVKHHKLRCSISSGSCPDRGHDGGHAAARLLAGACDRRLLSLRPEVWVEDDEPKACLLYAWQRLHERLCKGIEEWDRAVKAGTEKAAAIARAGMGTICDLSAKDRKHLFGLFESEEAVIEACAALIEGDLDLTADTLPREYEDPEF